MSRSYASSPPWRLHVSSETDLLFFLLFASIKLKQVTYILR
jgi:hypothetical protein